jgi:hypothetical protein
MADYRAQLANTIAPHLVIFNVHGEKENYALMRYGLTSTLMDDGYLITPAWAGTARRGGTTSSTWIPAGQFLPPRGSSWHQGWPTGGISRAARALVNPNETARHADGDA